MVISTDIRRHIYTMHCISKFWSFDAMVISTDIRRHIYTMHCISQVCKAAPPVLYRGAGFRHSF